MELKREVLRFYTNQVGNNRKVYSAAVSSYFGKMGAASLKKNRLEIKRKEELKKMLEEIRREDTIRSATDFQKAEMLRAGEIEFSPEGDLIFLEINEEEE